MTTLATYLSQIAWRKRISQVIGLIYGFLGLPFIIVSLFLIADPSSILSTQPLFIVLAFFVIVLGIAISVVSLGIGFWLQKTWAYNTALFLHGTPLLGELLRWLLIREGWAHGDVLTQPITSLGYQIWNILIVSFILIPRFQQWRRAKREMPFRNKL